MSIIKWIMIIITIITSFLINGYMYGEDINFGDPVVLKALLLGVILPWIIYVSIRFIYTLKIKKTSLKTDGEKTSDTKRSNTTKIVLAISIYFLIFGYSLISSSHTINLLAGIIYVIAGGLILDYSKKGYKLGIISCYFSIMNAIMGIVMMFGILNLMGIEAVALLMIMPIIQLAISFLILKYLRKDEIKQSFGFSVQYKEIS